jgi:hypothetical protein
MVRGPGEGRENTFVMVVRSMQRQSRLGVVVA